MIANYRMRRALLLALVLILAGIGTTTASETLLIDDFSNATSPLGTQWQGFSDRVMGGISDIQAGYVREGEGNAIRMVGSVSLENNGGFIQVRLPLASRGSLDASDYTGIAVEVKGAPGYYYLHVRTADSRSVRQYYEARVDVDTQWQRVEIPFAAFERATVMPALNAERLTSVALVGGKQEFDADVTIRKIEFYRD